MSMHKTLKVLLGIAGIALLAVSVASGVYVYRHYPRAGQTFEIQIADATMRVLVVSQGSVFKDALVSRVRDALGSQAIHVKGIDIGRLEGVNPTDWDRIVIVNTFMVRLNARVQRFVESMEHPGETLLVVTSGGADWQPEPGLRVDALTSASRRTHVEDLTGLVLEWLSRDLGTDWEPGDHVLALQYFAQVDRQQACDSIEEERARYQESYPDLQQRLNRIGYYFLRLADTQSAVLVLALNARLFPDSWNVHDSYGEALIRAGRMKEAQASYQRALALNPDGQSARTALQELQGT